MPAGHARTPSSATLVALVPFALLVTGCGAGDAAPAERVVLITCDTLRADRVGVYGSDLGLTPHLDAFAREAIVFDTAYSSAPITAPALCSLLTGRLPDELGMTSNRVSMPPEVTTLAELLQAAGIPTAAVVSNWVLRNSPGGAGVGVAQGFDRYDDEMTDRERNRARVLERVASRTTDAAARWLEERPGDRFFLWVHYQDPHGPYTPPEEHVRAVARPPGDEPPLPVGTTQRGHGELPEYQVLGDARHPDFYRARYEAEIRYFDQELGRLLDLLRSEGLFDGALILFTADHGESLGEHDYWFSHGQTVYDELVRIPLLVRYPRGASHPPVEERDGTRHADGLVGHVDVFPTVLEAFGLAAPPHRGRSLFAAPETGPARVLAHTLRTPGTRSRWEGLTDGRYHWMRSRTGAQLFDLRADPAELEDLAGREPDVARDLIARWEAELARVPAVRFEAERVPQTREQLEMLQKLGYAGDEED
jgi:arylsulfatase A-like enzyme